MKQVRFIPAEACNLQMREPQEGQQESREIEGRPIVFGVRSVNLTPWSSTRKVYEVLEPGCISRELLQKSDVVLNLNHSNMVPDVLGRYRNNPDKDTLSLELRGDGIDCRCDLPRTNNANDALELIRRGDIDGMSFAFEDDYEDTENGVSYERTNETIDGKEVWIRHVKRITGLYDVSIVTHPAYEQTSVATREQSDAIDKAIGEQLKRESTPATDDKGNTPADTPENQGGGAPSEDELAKAAEEAAAKRACGGKDDKRDDDKNDPDPDDKGETDEEREARELEEQEQRFREQQAMRLRYQARRINDDILESLSY